MKTNIELTLADGIGRLVFSAEDPSKPATIDYEVLDRLEAHLKSLSALVARDIDSVRALVLESANQKYFVVGANIEVLKTVDKNSVAGWIERGHEVFNRLADLPFPVIAKISGFALGGGLELAMACDFILAADTAHFGQPEAGLGFTPGWGGCARLPARIGPAAARELFFTGRVIDAVEAGRLGLALVAGNQAELEKRLSETLESIRKNSAMATAQIKRVLNAEENRAREFVRYAETVSTIACVTTGDTMERLEAFFAKRAGK
ncbi:MAG: enoyl-CoA hydratase/isomerase family protein [Treponemataceae bacterium]